MATERSGERVIRYLFSELSEACVLETLDLLRSSQLVLAQSNSDTAGCKACGAFALKNYKFSPA